MRYSVRHTGSFGEKQMRAMVLAAPGASLQMQERADPTRGAGQFAVALAVKSGDAMRHRISGGGA